MLLVALEVLVLLQGALVLDDLPVSAAFEDEAGTIYWGLTDGTVGVAVPARTPRVLFSAAELTGTTVDSGSSRPLGVAPSGVVQILAVDSGKRIYVGFKSGSFAAVIRWADGKAEVLQSGTVDSSAPRTGPILARADREVCWSLFNAEEFYCASETDRPVTYKSSRLFAIAATSKVKCWLDRSLRVACLPVRASKPILFPGVFSDIHAYGGKIYGVSANVLYELNSVDETAAKIYSAPTILRAAMTACGILAVLPDRAVLFQSDSETRLSIGDGISFVVSSPSSLLFGRYSQAGIERIACPRGLIPKAKKGAGQTK